MFHSRNTFTLFTLLIAWATFPFHPLNSMAGDYLNSAHGTSAIRPALSSTNYSTGNCAHCHEQHASIGGTTPAPTGGPDVYLEAGTEEQLCFACHDSSEANGAPDIDTDVTTTDNKGHLAQNYSGIHRVGETLSDIANTKHIECTDCHDPHKAGNTLHTPGLTTGNSIATGSPLKNVTGSDPDYFSTSSKYSIWEAPPQTDYNIEKPATKEYQICFKCHSGSVDDPETWRGGSSSDPANTIWTWTDVGQEFSPYNKSGHPVVLNLYDYPNIVSIGVPGGSKRRGLDSAQVLDPWKTNVQYQTMYCSDCHVTSSNGPHGSSTKWMLRGPNKAWPYLLASNNGSDICETEGGSDLFRRIETIAQNFDATDGLFCANCHPTDLSSNKCHSTSYHVRGRCVDCHIRVPHGGKISRLIAAAESDTSYASTTLPLRYTADGKGLNAGGTAVPVLRKFEKDLNIWYASGNCYSTFASTLNEEPGMGKDCNEHKNYTTLPEYW